MQNEWRPEIEAPEGEWLLARGSHRGEMTDPLIMCKIGGFWWLLDDKATGLRQTSWIVRTIPATNPNWEQERKKTGSMWFVIGAVSDKDFGGPEDIYTKVPAEWCHIPQNIQKSMVNRPDIINAKLAR